MNKRIVFVSAGFILALSIVFSCRKDVAKLASAAPAPLTADKCDTITYTKHISPIIQSNCATGSLCHGAGASQVNLTSYSLVKSIADNGKLKSYAIDGTPEIMPKGGPKLPQNQLDLIQCWLNNGEKE